MIGRGTLAVGQERSLRLDSKGLATSLSSGCIAVRVSGTLLGCVVSVHAGPTLRKASRNRQHRAGFGLLAAHFSLAA